MSLLPQYIKEGFVCKMVTSQYVLLIFFWILTMNFYYLAKGFYYEEEVPLTWIHFPILVFISTLFVITLKYFIGFCSKENISFFFFQLPSLYLIYFFILFSCGCTLFVSIKCYKAKNNKDKNGKSSKKRLNHKEKNKSTPTATTTEKRAIF